MLKLRRLMSLRQLVNNQQYNGFIVTQDREI